ncbi:hypothetical protein AB0J35_48650 [Nonomuraea angiospora]|uniref:hypothetical protein n=1 Tax=Nonomuraea angiospora TaxID=46172 RepID=UPI0034343AF8
MAVDACLPSVEDVLQDRRNGEALVEESSFMEHPHSRNVHASATFNVESGHWRVEAAVTKMTGYWGFHRRPNENEDEVTMNDFAVDINVP